MANPKKYFHDHLVLLLLSVNAFLTVVGSILLLVRLSTSQSSAYIVQYRSSERVGTFEKGTVVELLSFVAFSVLIFVITTALSLKTYPIHRQLTIVVLSLGILLLLLAIIISNALLVLS